MSETNTMAQDVDPTQPGGTDLPGTATGTDGVPGGDGNAGAVPLGAHGGLDTASAPADLPGGGSEVPAYASCCCPGCGLDWTHGGGSDVIDSRGNQLGKRRRRRCQCGYLFTTVEVIDGRRLPKGKPPKGIEALRRLGKELSEAVENMAHGG